MRSLLFVLIVATPAAFGNFVQLPLEHFAPAGFTDPGENYASPTVTLRTQEQAEYGLIRKIEEELVLPYSTLDTFVRVANKRVTGLPREPQAGLKVLNSGGTAATVMTEFLGWLRYHEARDPRPFNIYRLHHGLPEARQGYAELTQHAPSNATVQALMGVGGNGVTSLVQAYARVSRRHLARFDSSRSNPSTVLDDVARVLVHEERPILFFDNVERWLEPTREVLLVMLKAPELFRDASVIIGVSAKEATRDARINAHVPLLKHVDIFHHLDTFRSAAYYARLLERSILDRHPGLRFAEVERLVEAWAKTSFTIQMHRTRSIIPTLKKSVNEPANLADVTNGCTTALSTNANVDTHLQNYLNHQIELRNLVQRLQPSGGGA